jgi:hypothetical protein
MTQIDKKYELYNFFIETASQLGYTVLDPRGDAVNGIHAVLVEDGTHETINAEANYINGIKEFRCSTEPLKPIYG